MVIVSLLLLILLPQSSHCVDPSPLQDFCIADLDHPFLFINGFPCKNPTQVTSKDFFYDGFKQNPGILNTFGANVTRADVDLFPGLNTLGLSIVRVLLVPGGINPPHVHQRATKLVLVLEGKILVGLVTTDDVFYWKIVSVGELFVIPRGLIHFQLNIGEENGTFFASFNSQNPGFQFVANALFNSTPPIPVDVLTKTFLTDGFIIDLIRSRFSIESLI